MTGSHGVFETMPIDDRPTTAAPDDDPYLWLEEIEGDRALDFVEQQNRLTLQKFGGAGFIADRDTLAAIYDRPDNIPYVTRRGGFLYNIWTRIIRVASGGERHLGNFGGRTRNGRSCWMWTNLPLKKAMTGFWAGSRRCREPI